MNKLIGIPVLPLIIEAGVETYSKTQHQQLSALHLMEFNHGDLVLRTAVCSFEVR